MYPTSTHIKQINISFEQEVVIMLLFSHSFNIHVFHSQNVSPGI